MKEFIEKKSTPYDKYREAAGELRAFDILSVRKMMSFFPHL